MNRTKRLNVFILQHSRLSIILLYNILTVAVLAMFYPVLPELMGYPPDFMEAGKQLRVSYDLQYLIIMLLAVAAGTICLFIALRGIEKWSLPQDSNTGIEVLRSIRRKCINLPYFIYIFQISFVIVFIIVLLKTKGSVITGLRLTILGLSVISLIAVISHIFSQWIFTEILSKTHIEERIEGIRINFKAKLFLQVIPMLIVAVIFTGTLGYAKIIEEKGNLAYQLCNDLLQENKNSIHGTTPEQILQSIPKSDFENFKTSCFVVFNGKFISSDGYKPSAFFCYYLDHPFGKNHNRIYGETNEIQGVITQISGDTGEIIAGIKYELASPQIIWLFFVELLTLLVFFIFIIYYISKRFTQEISSVTDNLNEIIEGGCTDQNKKIPVTSNDEISDLVLAFNKIRERQLEYDKLKDEFMANISHELRIPLNVILATAQLTELYTKNILTADKDKINRNTKIIKQNCRRLVRLINNLIDITKIDAGFMQLHLQPLNVVKLVETITLSVAEYARTKGLSLQFETDTQKTIMYCDPDKIERIILNLLSNAIKYTNQDGDIHVSVHKDAGKLIISVKDTGIGIPENKQEIIFERFRQVEQSLVRDHEGSGIGLSLVKSFVEMHNGKIYVESTEGIGSEFIIEMPVRETRENSCDYSGMEHILFNNESVERINVELSEIYMLE